MNHNDLNSYLCDPNQNDNSDNKSFCYNNNTDLNKTNQTNNGDFYE